MKYFKAAWYFPWGCTITHRPTSVVGSSGCFTAPSCHLSGKVLAGGGHGGHSVCPLCSLTAWLCALHCGCRAPSPASPSAPPHQQEPLGTSCVHVQVLFLSFSHDCCWHRLCGTVDLGELWTLERGRHQQNPLLPATWSHRRDIVPLGHSRPGEGAP